MLVKWKKTSERLSQKLKRTPSNKEIAKKMRLSKARAEQVVAWLSVQTSSLDAPVGDDGQTQVADLLEDEGAKSPDADIARLMDRERVENLLYLMSAREKQILDMRFGLMDGTTYTLAEVAKKLGVSRERVRQIEEQALKKLKRFVRAQKEAAKRRRGRGEKAKA